MAATGIDIAVKLVEAQGMLRKLRAYTTRYYEAEAAYVRYRQNAAKPASRERSSQHEVNLKRVVDEMWRFTHKSFELAALVQSMSDKGLRVSDVVEEREKEPADFVSKAQEVLDRIEAAILKPASSSAHPQPARSSA